MVAGMAVSLVGSVPAGAAKSPQVRSWSIQQRAVSTPSSGSVISCPSVSRCVASEGNTVLTTIDGGTTWKTSALPSGISNLGGISCPTTRKCWAVGLGGVAYDDTSEMMATSDGGRTWTTESLPVGTEGLWGAISCPDTSHCWALTLVSEANGTGEVFTTDGGKTWIAGRLDIYGNPSGRDISCSDRSSCWAADGSPSPHGEGTIVELAGKYDPTGTPPPANYNGISCPTASHCWAVTSGDTVIRTTDAGDTWTTANLPAETGPAEGIDCPTTLDCWAVGFGVVVASHNGGSIWSNDTIPNGIDQIDDISCPTTSACWAVGYTSNDAVILVGSKR
jgi:photosystem II stability/assembly factor-like uncharacterized protein